MPARNSITTALSWQIDALNSAKQQSYTDKKENQIFLIQKEIQKGSVAKSYMNVGLLMYG
jgi:hypothetical protein